MNQETLLQLSEVYRRGVVTPLDEATAVEMAHWGVGKTPYVEFLPVTDPVVFQEVDATGIWERVNDSCDTLIGDYEEDVVNVTELPRAIDVVVVELKQPHSEDVLSFFHRLVAVLSNARKRQFPVFFVF